MTKTLLHRHTLATSLFLLSTCNPCAGIKQKSQQDIDGQKLLQAITRKKVNQIRTSAFQPIPFNNEDNILFKIFIVLSIWGFLLMQAKRLEDYLKKYEQKRSIQITRTATVK